MTCQKRECAGSGVQTKMTVATVQTVAGMSMRAYCGDAQMIQYVCSSCWIVQRLCALFDAWIRCDVRCAICFDGFATHMIGD